jgi:rRNA-processing protein EBP2
LLDESAAVKASEDAKRQRDLKKFGKKVQIEKLQERQKKKSEEMEKIKMLKRSEKNNCKGIEYNSEMTDE